jgi:hypothetical protein
MNSTKAVLLAAKVLVKHFESHEKTGATSLYYSGLNDAITAICGELNTVEDGIMQSILHQICAQAIAAMYDTANEFYS